MSRVVFSNYANQELEDAIRYYEIKLLGLGMKFKDEVRKAVLQIVEYPHAWSIERGDVRKYLLYKFPTSALVVLVAVSLVLNALAVGLIWVVVLDY